MKRKPYPKYKDSGVEWLGEVPESWEVKRLGYYFNQRREKVSDKDFPPLSVTKNGVIPQMETAAKSDDGDNRKRVCKGDFTINSRSDRKGSSGLSSLDGSVSLIYTVLEPENNFYGGFAHHLFRSYPFQEEFYRYGKGIVADLWTTNYSEMKNITLGVPHLEEQKQIAAFLDRETARVDDLIAKQERMIELLAEKRGALISQAVTRGLNSRVTLQDSGVEWLGEVPQHWEVKRLKHLSRQIVDGSHLTPTYVAEGVPFLRVTDIHKTEINWDTVARIPDEEHKILSQRCKPERGDLLLSKNGTIGVPFVVNFDDEFSIFVSLCLIKANDLLSTEFLKFLFESDVLEEQISYGSKASTVTNLHLEKIREFQLPCPPLLEQKAIVKYLDRQTAKIDALTDKAREAIALMKEHRSSLIAAAVTGKIDVRGQ